MNRIIILAGILLLFAALPLVGALGITPGRTTIDYEPGLEKEIKISVLNNEHKPMKVIITSVMKENLQGAVTLFQDYLEFMPSEERKDLTYKIKLPEGMMPGLHTGEIIALEVPKSDLEENTVGATIAVVSQIYIYVPCPGKCIELGLEVLEAETDSLATFIVPVISRGELDIGDLRATIDIYRESEKITTLETDYASLGSGKRTELSAKWNVSVERGDYKAKVTAFYDGQTEYYEKYFTVGEKMVSIESIMVNNFQLGEIAKLQILVANKWGEELKEVYANLLVYNERNQVMADVKSATDSIPGLSKKELIAYWDTVGVKEGEYSGKLMIVYGEKSTDRNLVLKVSENNLDITGVGYAIRPQARGINIITILIIIIIILLVVNLAWFIFFSRFMKKRKERKSRIIRAD